MTVLSMDTVWVIVEWETPLKMRCLSRKNTAVRNVFLLSGFPYAHTVRSIPLLSQRLLALRKRYELTQEAFAERTGFDYKFYQAIESGRKKQVWLETVERLADAYGLAVWELLGPDEPVPRAPRQPKLHEPLSKAAASYRKVGRPKKRTSGEKPNF